jgi:hypothetical protein
LLRSAVQQPSQLRHAFHAGDDTWKIVEDAMKVLTLSRRRAIKLASSFAAAARLLNSVESRAQPTAGATVFEMASFISTNVDADAAFAKALTAISNAAADANKAGRPAHIVFNLEKNAAYRVKRPLALKQLSGFELNGNGAQLINTTLGSTLLISSSSHVTIRDLTIDYDPLPFTQGTITGFDRAALQIMVKVDPGYPNDSAFLATITDGFFRVMDRRTRALKAGARDFLGPSRVERVGEGLIKVHLQWSANDLFPSQLPIVVGDVVTITNSSADDCGGRQRLDYLHRLKAPGFTGHGDIGNRGPWWDGIAQGLHRSGTAAQGRRDGSPRVYELGRLALRHGRARADDGGLHLREHLRRCRERARLLLPRRSEGGATALPPHPQMGCGPDGRR